MFFDSSAPAHRGHALLKKHRDMQLTVARRRRNADHSTEVGTATPNCREKFGWRGATPENTRN
eukprot:14080276-Alexandrium_andersonii.AAC.1